MNSTKIFLFLMTLTALVACSTEKRSYGGQDGGGGNTVMSTAEEAREAVGSLWQRSILGENDTSESFFDDLYYQTTYVTEKEVGVSKEDLARLKVIAAKVFLYSSTPWIVRPLTNPAQYLIKSDLDVRETGSCKVSDNDHADASVTSFKYGATVCFSIENLTKIPRSSLRLEVLGLLVHEMAHLSGYDEKDARLLQAAILSRSSMYFSAAYATSVIHNIENQLEAAEGYFTVTLNNFTSSPEKLGPLVELPNLLHGLDGRVGDLYQDKLASFVLEPVSGAKIEQLELAVSNADSMLGISYPAAWSLDLSTNDREQNIEDYREKLNQTREQLTEIRLRFYEFVQANFPELIDNLNIQKEVKNVDAEFFARLDAGPKAAP